MDLNAKMDIGTFTKRYGVTARAVRLYEDAGLLKLARAKGGRRIYTEADGERLEAVLILKQCGRTINEIRNELDTFIAGGLILPLKTIDEQLDYLEVREQTNHKAKKILREMKARLRN